jgi:deoxyribonucleoside regulator
MADVKKQKTGNRKAKAGVTAIPLRSADDYVIQAAWMYYQEGLNQHSIATSIGVSRASVVNYLQQARERGYVRISLDDSLFTGHRLSQKLCDLFSLKAAYVLPEAPGEDDEVVFMRVAQGAAVWLSSLLNSGDKLGVSWGRTIYELAEAIESSPVPDLVVSQLVGSMSTPYGFTAEICSAHLARKLSASCINLHAPAVLSDAELAKRLRSEPIISAQLDALRHCNKAVFAAGSFELDSHIVGSGVATVEELRWYKKRGATGVVCGRIIDRSGLELDGPLKERMMAIELEDLRGLDIGLLVSTGEDRVLPMLSALEGRYATHLVTSAATAEALIAQAESAA